MTAVTDATAILNLLGLDDAKGSGLHQKIIGLYQSHRADDKPGEEANAQAFLDGLKAQLVGAVKERAAQEVYAGVLRQAHFPANQKALLEAVKEQAKDAGDVIVGEAVAVDVPVDVPVDAEVKP